MALNETESCIEPNPVPVIVTSVASFPVAGLTEVICGPPPETVKVWSLFDAWPDTVTTTGPVVTPVGG